MAASDEHEALVALVEELVEAHFDTIELALARLPPTEWEGHVEYLRALQRTGLEILAGVDEHVSPA